LIIPKDASIACVSLSVSVLDYQSKKIKKRKRKKNAMEKNPIIM